MTKQIFLGVVDDPRTLKEKKKDWNAKELLAFAPTVEWKEKKKWKSYTERNQKGTSTCVPQSVSKILEINEKNETKSTKVFSAAKPYFERTNNSAGAYLHEMLKYAVDPAYYTLESRIQSQNLQDDEEVHTKAQAWGKVDENIAKKHNGKSYLLVDKDIDQVAYWLSQGYGVVGLFYFTSKEWSPKYPKILTNKADWLYHAVAITDFGLINGKKFLKIEDSAHFGGRSERWISEDFFNARCYARGMVFDRPNEEPEELLFTFKKIMRFGERSTDVKFLQERLKVEGLFPLHIDSSGYYGEISRQAVEKYQRKYQVASEWELNLVQGKICGLKTLNALNKTD
jgi:hypothetical protein